MMALLEQELEQEPREDEGSADEVLEKEEKNRSLEALLRGVKSEASKDFEGLIVSALAEVLFPFESSVRLEHVLASNSRHVSEVLRTAGTTEEVAFLLLARGRDSDCN